MISRIFCFAHSMLANIRNPNTAHGIKIHHNGKNHKHRVGPAAMRELAGSINRYPGAAGVMIAASGITSGAREEARDLGIQVWTLGRVLELAREANYRSP